MAPRLKTLLLVPRRSLGAGTAVIASLLPGNSRKSSHRLVIARKQQERHPGEHIQQAGHPGEHIQQEGPHPGYDSRRDLIPVMTAGGTPRAEERCTVYRQQEGCTVYRQQEGVVGTSRNVEQEGSGDAS